MLVSNLHQIRMQGGHGRFKFAPNSNAGRARPTKFERILSGTTQTNAPQRLDTAVSAFGCVFFPPAPACVETVESGKMAKDIALLSSPLPFSCLCLCSLVLTRTLHSIFLLLLSIGYLNTEEFIVGVSQQLQGKIQIPPEIPHLILTKHRGRPVAHH
jgi:hypothetical protein